MRKITLFQRILGFFGISALTILFFACPDSVGNQEQQDDGLKVAKQQKATVTFSVMDNPARTVLPQVSLDDVAWYELLGGRSGEAETILIESFTETETSVSLDPGTWNFTLDAYNEDDELILQGKVMDKQIILAGTNQVNFSLSVVKSGMGSIRITLNFPVEAGITRISTNGDNIDSEDFTPDNSGNFLYTKDGVDADDCLINFEFYCGSILRTVVSELVLVRSNLTSSKTITLLGEDLKPVLTGTVSISGTTVVGETLTANTSLLNGVGAITYQWKRGDSADTAGTNITDNATTGTYTLVAEDEGKYITVAVRRAGYVSEIISAPTSVIDPLVPVILSSITADGSETQTTTVLTLTFDQAINGLTAADITLSGIDDLNKGVLSGSGPVYTLPISGFTSGGTLTVAVAKPCYTISGSPETVTVYYYAIPVTLSSVTANGSSTQTTTQLTLTFSQAITGLTASDITLTGVTGVQKGTLSGSGPSYTLGISGHTSSGSLSVSVSKYGYAISDSPKTVYIYSAISVSFNSVTANGSSTQTTTQLTLTFSQAITGLSASDITLSGVSATKGTISGSGSTYTLGISGVTATGTLNVAVSKSGYNISGSPKTVSIYYAIPVTFNSVTANGSAAQTTTTLTLTFSQAITGLSASDITISGVLGATKGTLSGSGTTYTLGISGISLGGTLTVEIGNKAGYAISNSSRTVEVYKEGQVPRRDNLEEMLNWLKVNTNTQSGKEYTIVLNPIESLPPHTLEYTGKTNITVRLISDGGERFVDIINNGSLFTITSSITLVLDNNVTLRGRTTNTSPLITINNGGKLLMNNGSKITGNNNTNSSSYGGAVNVNASGTFEMTGGEISGNTAYYCGGGVYSSGSFTMTSGRISGNKVSNSNYSYNYGGGGVFVSGGTFTMNNGEISGNISSSSAYGGGVNVYGGTFTMNNGELSGNTGSYYGGGVYIRNGTGITFTMNDGKITNNTSSSGGGVYASGTFEMKSGEISDNTASSSGGGVYSSGSFTMSNSAKILRNTASSSGGGVYISGGTFTLTNGEISGNKATPGSSSNAVYGGGVGVSGGTFTMNNGEIFGNTASNTNTNFYYTDAAYGGGVSVSGGTFNMNSGKITGNKATTASTQAITRGGGVFAYSYVTFTMTGGEIATNEASRGGGVDTSGTFKLENSGKITNNKALAGSGGGVYSGGGSFTMADSTIISGNTASASGGGVYSGGGSFTMTDGTISGNTASASGGGLCMSDASTVRMTGGTISGNTAASYGGGVYVAKASSGTTVGDFVKTGGIIYGYTSGISNSNTVKTGNTVKINSGHAVYVDDTPVKRRESNANTNDHLDSRSPGGWE